MAFGLAASTWIRGSSVEILRINGRPFVVVGVAAQEFRGAGMQTRDIWLVIGPEGRKSSVVAGGRLRPGVSVAAASNETAAIGEAVERQRGIAQPGKKLRALPFSLAGGNRNVVAGFAVALMVIVSLVLAAACANVAGILLARSMARTREMALRTALGAGRGRLVRQLLTETLMLFLLGGALGVSLARGMVVLAPLFATLPIPLSFPVTLDLRVLSFALSLSLLAALMSGLVPAFKGSKSDPIGSLKEGSPSDSGRSRLRGAFVVAQTALSILLVVMAGLFVRAVRYAGMTDPGFDPRGVEIAALDLSQADGDEATRSLFWRNVIERVRGLPSVETASVALVPPGGFEGYGLGSVTAADALVSDSFEPAWNLVDSGYFATLRIPILSGRDFSAGDVESAPPVAIVADTIARRLWPGQAAVGKSLIVSEFNPQARRSERRRVQIVGVVGDIKSSSLIDGLAGSYVYLPLSQRTMSAAPFTDRASIVARRRALRPLAADIAAVVRELNPNLVIVRSETLQDSVALGLAPQRLLGAVTGSLGLVGLLLASIGVYGVIAYTVALRRREFGIRMALGARRISIVWMVLRHGMLLVSVGAVIGLAVSVGAGEVLSVFLYGLPAIHVPTFLGTALLFLVIGAVACYIPARHAISIEPLRALRID